jgi:hypothetical protein
MNAAFVELAQGETSTQPQDTVARLQGAIQTGVVVLIPGAYEIRVPQPRATSEPCRDR